MRRSFLLALASLLLLSHGAAARAQDAASGRCDGPVDKYKEMSRPARVTLKPEPGFTEEARQNGVSGAVKLAAVFCRTGRVTDVEVLQGLPHGLTERAVEAVKRVTFTPGEKDGRPASQSVRFEYIFNLPDHRPDSEDDCFKKPERCAGRLVEEVEFEGNGRLTHKELSRRIRTRPGDRFDAARIQRDLQSLLNSPALDKQATHVSAEGGPRGGVIVIFTVAEVPVIRSIEIYGLSSITAEELKKALRDKRIGVGVGEPYSREKVEAAVDAIRSRLAERGRPSAFVEVLVQGPPYPLVNLVFAITEQP